MTDAVDAVADGDAPGRQRADAAERGARRRLVSVTLTRPAGTSMRCAQTGSRALFETRTLLRMPARSNVNVPVRPPCVSLQTAIDPLGALRLQKTSVDSVSGPPAGMTTEAVAPCVQARRPGWIVRMPQSSVFGGCFSVTFTWPAGTCWPGVQTGCVEPFETVTRAVRPAKENS